MKKLIIALLVLSFSVSDLSAQNKDSLAKEIEWEQLRRKGDSLHKVNLARDSAFQQQMNDLSRDVNRIIEDDKQKEINEATEQVMKQHEKEQRAKRQTMLWATAGFLLAAITGGIVFKKIKGKTNQSS